MSSFKPVIRVDKTKLYMVLGAPFHVDAATIKSCYKRLAVQHHPDKHVSSSPQQQRKSAELFQEVALAYEVLSDPAKRAAYDAHGMPGVEALQAQEAAGVASARDSAGDGDGGGGGGGGRQGRQGGFGDGGDRAGRTSGRGWQDGDWGDATAGQASATREGAAADECGARRLARERAFRTYRGVFGHNPVADLYPGPVHNMAAQRGGGSFDDVQKARLNDLFDDMRLTNEQSSTRPAQAASGSGGGSGGGGGGGSGSRCGGGGGVAHPFAASVQPKADGSYYVTKGRYAGQAWLH
jgi:DnaJ-class molecular chaperone